MGKDKNGNWIPGTRHFTDSEENEIAKIYLAGHSARAIARAYGLPGKDAILGTLRRQKVKQRSPGERNRIYALNPHKFDVIDNEHAAYWLGFLMADGCIAKRSLTIKLRGDDFHHLQRLLDFLESEAPIHHSVVRGRYKSAAIDVTHKHLANRLKQLGITTGRPYPLRPTKFLCKGTKRHFIRGFWDGDGCAAKNPNDGINFCGPKPLMCWLRDTIASLSPTLTGKRNIQKHTVSDIYYLRYSGRRVALAVFDVMFKDATVWLPRKRDVIVNWPPPQKRERDEMGCFT